MSNITICLHCGGDVKLDRRTGIPTCLNCRREYKDTLADTSYELQEIVKARQQREFLKAEELCEELKKMQPESSEVYWQSLLAELGVVYVKEGNVSKPTFFSFSYDDREKIKDSENYKKAIMFAKSEDDRRFYEEKATELDDLLKEFFDLVAKENSYDIFISFKQTEEVTNAQGETRAVETEDCAKAREIYNYFKDKYRVFFSPVSIGKDTGIQGEKYEPKILKALQTSQAMILVGTKRDYLAAQWVENEWKRFRYFIEKGKKDKRSLILAYMRQIPALPLGLKDIQLPNVDMFNATYLKELEKQLDGFVSTTKGLRSLFKGRNIKEDFTDEDTEFNFGHTVTRVKINVSGDRQTIQVSASEERNLQAANNMLEHSKFKDALNSYNGILRMNPKNATAYWGRFLALAKCPNSDGKNLKKNIAFIKPEYYADIDKAIDNSSDTDFSWKIIDALIDCLDVNLPKWTAQKTLYDVILKYIDESRASCVLDKLKARFEHYLLAGNLKTCEEIFADARKIFFDEHREDNISYMASIAECYFKAGRYDYAKKLYEELVLARKTGDMYLMLLCSRLKTSSIEQFKFKLDVNPEDDSSAKTPAELDLDEIIERIIICEKNHPFIANSHSVKAIFNCVYYQIGFNKNNAPAFIETVVSCLQSISAKIARNFLFECAKEYLYYRNFKDAKTYFTEILAHDQQDAEAHWGLLKCALKVSNDGELMAKRNKLTRYEEFENAKNSATNEQFDYFMSVYNGDANIRGYSANNTSSGKKSTSKTYAPSKGFVGDMISTFFHSLPAILFLAIAVLIVGAPEKIFSYVHWGWVLAGCIILFAIMFFAVIGLRQDYSSIPNKRLFNLRCTITMSLALISMALAIFGFVYGSKNVYTISTTKEFNLIANAPGAKKATFVLTEDLDFEGVEFKKFAKVKKFSGTLDGQGHTIKNLTVVKEKKFTSKNYDFGLYRTITEDGVIKNLTFEDCSITVEMTESTFGDYSSYANFGILAGVNDGLITNVKMIDTTFDVNYNDPITYVYVDVGGFAGEGRGTVSNSSYTSSLATSSYKPYMVKFNLMKKPISYKLSWRVLVGNTDNITLTDNYYNVDANIYYDYTK